MDTKLCVVCGEALPLLRRSDRRYCGVGCRVRAHKIRGDCAASRRESPPAAAILGIAATAATIEALYRELAQEREQHQRAREEMEKERQTAAELRAEVQRIRTEQAAEPERLRVAIDEERQRLHDEFDIEQERLRLEATFAQERLRTALREERRLANGREGALYATVTQLRDEKARAEDLHRTAEHSNTQLLAERDEVRGQLQQAQSRCKLLTEKESATRQELEQMSARCNRLAAKRKVLKKRLTASRKQISQLKKQLSAADEQIGIISDQHEDLEIEYDSLRNRLVEEYRALLADQQQRYLQGASAQHKDLLTENARLQSERDELQSHNERLTDAYRALQVRADQQTDKMTHLETIAARQRRQLNHIEKHVLAHLAPPATATASAPRQAQRELPPQEDRQVRSRSAAKRKERREIEGHAQPARLQAGSVLKVAGALAAGGAAAKLAIDGYNFSRRQKSLAAAEKRRLLTGRVDKPGSDSEN